MGIQERREREKKQRRNDILDAAEEVFFSQGVNMATMDEVAEQAELSKGTLYLYFKNKDELLLGIAIRALSLLHNMFQHAVEKNRKGLQQTRAIGEAYYEFSQKYANYFNMIVHYETSQLQDTDPESLASQCHNLGQKVMQTVAAAVENGIKDGTIRSDLDPKQTAYLLQGTSTGIIQLVSREHQHIHDAEDFKPQDLMNSFMNMMHHALKK